MFALLILLLFLFQSPYIHFNYYNSIILAIFPFIIIIPDISLCTLLIKILLLLEIQTVYNKLNDEFIFSHEISLMPHPLENTE